MHCGELGERRVILIALGLGLLLSGSGCQIPKAKEMDELRRENESLRAEVARLLDEASVADGAEANIPLTPIRGFTVGLAASQKNFDEDAFRRLLTGSLENSAQERSFEVESAESNEEVAKIRGMLIQQYLAADEIPVRLTNLTYRARSTDNDFKVGGRVVPKEGRTGNSGLIEHPGPLSGVLRRKSPGRYVIQYEELGEGRGQIPVQVRDAEMMAANQGPRFARQGDLSFNWELDLDKVHVYRVENFQGDMGDFVRRMRYSGIQASIGQYQRLRDLVFLFGYGSHVTGLVSQIRTPDYISEVEVRTLDQSEFDELRSGMNADEIQELLKGGTWKPCTFVDFSEGTKVWERPPGVIFPFVSRQKSAEKNLTFFTKYDAEGSRLIGDFESTP